MEDKSIEVLVADAEYSIIKIQGKEFKIGKIKPIFYFRLIKILGNIFGKCIKEIKTIGDDWLKKNDIEAIATFFSLLDENEYIKVISLLLETDDLEFCKKIDQYELLDLVALFLKHNDLGLFIKKVQRVIGVVGNQIKDVNMSS